MGPHKNTVHCTVVPEHREEAQEAGSPGGTRVCKEGTIKITRLTRVTVVLKEAVFCPTSSDFPVFRRTQIAIASLTN